MEPSCSTGPGDSKPGPSKVPTGNNNNASDSDSDESQPPNNNQDVQNLNNNTMDDENQNNEMECRDFEEEKEMLLQYEQMEPKPHFSGDLASANSSLDSNPENLSEYDQNSSANLPHCSQGQLDDSNATIRNMLQNRQFIIDSMKSNKLNLYKSNFMKSLLSGTQVSSRDIKAFTSKLKRNSCRPLKISVMSRAESKPYDVSARQGPIRPLALPAEISSNENLNNNALLNAPSTSAAADLVAQYEDAPEPVPEDVPEEPAEDPLAENPESNQGPASRRPVPDIPVRPLTPASHERADTARLAAAPGQNRPRPPAENYDGLSAHQLIARAQQIALEATYSNPNIHYEDPLGYRLKVPNFANSFNDDSDEDFRGEPQEELHCTCLSSHEDDDADDEEETVEENVDILMKRKPEFSPVRKQTPMKKFCSDKPGSSCESPEPERPKLSPSTSLVTTSSLQGPPDMKHWLKRFQNWTNTDKVQALDALISRCSPGQVRHMMKSIEPIFQRDFISLLPKELALTVLGYLRPMDLLRAAQTCKYWQFLADDNLLWKEQCRRSRILSCKNIPRSLPKCASPWKAAYMRYYLIEHNWLNKPVNKPIIMRGHDDHVITCLQFSGNRILSGSDDTTLKVWSAVSGKCLRTLVGHSGGVWSSQMVGDLVISGSTDRTLRVWNAKTGHCHRVLAGHTSTVRCMHLNKNRVVSGSRDATLRVWSIPEGRCLKVLIGHLAAVRCVQYDGKVVVSGAYDYFVKVWNPETGECLHTLAGHTNRVYSLQFDGVHVVSGSLDTSIRVWDVETGQLKHTLIGHQSLTSGMELRSNVLVSGNADSTVKIWDINTGHCLHTLSGPNKHQSAVTCLQASKRFVITSSDDGTVKLWDLFTGDFIRNLVRLGSGGSGGVVWRIRASSSKLVCAVGSRNGTEETKLLVLDFDLPGACRKCDE